MELVLDLNPLWQLDPGYNDWLVHPSVEFIPEGLNGYKWWLAVTPYRGKYGKPSDWEQPLLFCGEDNSNNPPQRWKFVGVVQERHPRGFNADPNLYYDGNKLWIIWKESGTYNTEEEKASTSIMGRWYDGKTFGPVKKNVR